MAFGSRLPGGKWSPDSFRAAVVARRYYLEDRSKVEIANELGISRFKVARLLEHAKAEGIVRIDINGPAGVDTELGDLLARQYRLREAWVIDTSHTTNDGELIAELGGAAAALLAETVGDDDVVGVSWGRTVRSVVDALESLPTRSVVQIAGGLSRDIDDGAVELVRRVAERAGAPAYPLHAPLFVADVAIARRLRVEPQISRTLAMLDQVTTVIAGVGPWNGESSLAAELGPADSARLAGLGAVAEICGLVIGQGGQVVDDDLRSRTIGITTAQLHTARNVLVVAGGQQKHEALRAVLATGFVSLLVTDLESAISVLRNETT